MEGGVQPANANHGPELAIRQSGLDAGYTVNAMVGQVNGQAIYADEVFEPIADQLTALGRNRSASEFKLAARQLIMGRLSQIVLGALILGEAQRDLSDQEKAGLEHLLKKQREELVRYWGGGSAAVAQRRLIEETDRTLDETLEDTRRQMLVQRYQQQKLLHKINITRKDVERYYRDHYDEFNSPSTRTLRLIRASVPVDVDRIEERLQRGDSFADVAADPGNQYRPEQGGLMPEKMSVGSAVFSYDQLNEQMMKLAVGERSGRMDLGRSSWWVYVQAIDPAKSQPIRDVQLEIEGILRRQRFQYLTQQYREQLFESGSFDPLDQMGESLLRIAVTRYLTPA